MGLQPCSSDAWLFLENNNNDNKAGKTLEDDDETIFLPYLVAKVSREMLFPFLNTPKGDESRKIENKQNKNKNILLIVLCTQAEIKLLLILKRITYLQQ